MEASRFIAKPSRFVSKLVPRRSAYYRTTDTLKASVVEVGNAQSHTNGQFELILKANIVRHVIKDSCHNLGENLLPAPRPPWHGPHARVRGKGECGCCNVTEPPRASEERPRIANAPCYLRLRVPKPTWFCVPVVGLSKPRSSP